MAPGGQFARPSRRRKSPDSRRAPGRIAAALLRPDCQQTLTAPASSNDILHWVLRLLQLPSALIRGLYTPRRSCFRPEPDIGITYAADSSAERNRKGALIQIIHQKCQQEKAPVDNRITLLILLLILIPH